jgi:hypothetical protein
LKEASMMQAGSKSLLAVCFMPVSCLAFPSTFKMKATRFNETLVDFPTTARRYITEHRTFHNHRRKSRKSFTL